MKRGGRTAGTPAAGRGRPRGQDRAVTHVADRSGETAAKPYPRNPEQARTSPSSRRRHRRQRFRSRANQALTAADTSVDPHTIMPW